MLTLPGKVFSRHNKTRPAQTEFTLCLPGSPKVNAGGACGAWLPGRELLRISAFRDRIEGTGGLFRLEVSTQPGMTETSLVPDSQAFAGTTFDELVQWMVQDASLDR
jgi:hypothetical protein